MYHPHAISLDRPQRPQIGYGTSGLAAQQLQNSTHSNPQPSLHGANYPACPLLCSKGINSLGQRWHGCVLKRGFRGEMTAFQPWKRDWHWLLESTIFPFLVCGVVLADFSLSGSLSTPRSFDSNASFLLRRYVLLLNDPSFCQHVSSWGFSSSFGIEEWRLRGCEGEGWIITFATPPSPSSWLFHKLRSQRRSGKRDKEPKRIVEVETYEKVFRKCQTSSPFSLMLRLQHVVLRA